MTDTVTTSAELAALYSAHRLGLVRLAVLLVDNLASAEDVVQDAFLAFSRNSRRLADPDAALGYLRVCVVNGTRSMIRRRQVARNYQHLSLQPDVAGADDGVVLADQQRTVLQALHRLPDRQREVLVLRYWSELSEAQISYAYDELHSAVDGYALNRATVTRFDAGNQAISVPVPTRFQDGSWMIANASPDAFTVVNTGNPALDATTAVSWNPFTGQITELVRAARGEALVSILPWGAQQPY